ncbi:hypothetical protein OS42_40980 [Dickeya oryzae]
MQEQPPYHSVLMTTHQVIYALNTPGGGQRIHRLNTEYIGPSGDRPIDTSDKQTNALVAYQ